MSVNNLVSNFAYVEVLDINIAMLGLVEVLLSHEYLGVLELADGLVRRYCTYTFLEDVLVDLLAISFRNKHSRESLALFVRSRRMQDLGIGRSGSG